MTHEKKTIHVIVGPTASGKSALSLCLARQSNGVIINADSMQIYREIPILAATPTPEERQDVLHKLYGVLSIIQPCSAAKWRDMAITAIEKTLQQGKTPILVGGTGLYVKALIDGLSPIPSVPQPIRVQTIQDYETMGGEAFKQRLATIDRITAERLEANDSQRLIRAWEVYRHTGKPLSHYQDMAREKPPHDWFFAIHILLPDRDALYERINRRFDIMLDNGMMDEVKSVHALPNLNPLLPSLKALGLPHLRAYLDGKEPLDEAVNKAKAASRQYAKRQYTWFRNQLAEVTDKQKSIRHYPLFGQDIVLND